MLQKSVVLMWSLYVLCFSINGYCRSPISSFFTDSEIQKLELDIYEEMKRQQIAGLAFAVTYEDQTVYEGSLGLSDVTNEEAFTVRHRTSVGSITKTFVSFAVYSLETNYPSFSIDTPVASLLPWFNRADMSRITVRHLLSHTSGLQRSLGRDSIANLDTLYGEKKYGPLYDEIQEIMDDVELMFSEPGVMAQYSNLGYALLGSIIVQVAEDNGFLFSGTLVEEKLAEYMRAEVFGPLGLEGHMDLMVPSRDTALDSKVYTGLFGNFEKDPWAFRYQWPQMPNLGMAVAHSGVISDVQGLAKFMTHLDRMMTGKSYDVIGKSEFLELMTMEARSYDVIAKDTPWGYGNGAILYERMKTPTRSFLGVGHTGTGYGSRALMHMDPLTGVGVSLIINDKASNRHAIANILFEAAFQKTQFRPSRMETEALNRLSAADNGMKATVALTPTQEDLFPNLAEQPLTGADLYRQLQRSSGRMDVMHLLNSLGSTEFVSGSFGNGSAYRFGFYRDGEEVSPEILSLSQLQDVRVEGVKGEKRIPLFKDLNPAPTESLIREGFTPIFLVFSFQQLDFEMDPVTGDIQYLVFDRTFFQKARPIGALNKDGSPVNVFPFAERVAIEDFPGQVE